MIIIPTPDNFKKMLIIGTKSIGKHFSFDILYTFNYYKSSISFPIEFSKQIIGILRLLKNYMNKYLHKMQWANEPFKLNQLLDPSHLKWNY